MLSQVILSLQLPFAVVPLLLFTTRRKYIGALAFGRGMATLLWTASAMVVALNVWLLSRTFG